VGLAASSSSEEDSNSSRCSEYGVAYRSRGPLAGVVGVTLDCSSADDECGGDAGDHLNICYVCGQFKCHQFYLRTSC
jgi:hypothetical protein